MVAHTSAQRFSRAAAVLAITLLTLTAVFCYRSYLFHRYYGEVQAISRIIEHWGERCPATTDKLAWDNAISFCQIALWNVCFSESHVKYDDVVKLHLDIEDRSSEKIDVATIDWFWSRLSTAGPGGAGYTKQMQPLWEESTRGIRANVAGDKRNE
jgi:hypothetical protein